MTPRYRAGRGRANGAGEVGPGLRIDPGHRRPRRRAGRCGGRAGRPEKTGRLTGEVGRGLEHRAGAGRPRGELDGAVVGGQAGPGGRHRPGRKEKQEGDRDGKRRVEDNSGTLRRASGSEARRGHLRGKRSGGHLTLLWLSSWSPAGSTGQFPGVPFGLALCAPPEGRPPVVALGARPHRGVRAGSVVRLRGPSCRGASPAGSPRGRRGPSRAEPSARPESEAAPSSTPRRDGRGAPSSAGVGC